ncbi:hypothetical protein LINPERPRIM_LOCUS15426 [Linum perenne]
MIKTLSPYSNTATKTAEIMSKYRPIAPKPDCPSSNSESDDMSSSMSQKIRESPYLRNLWPQLQARPTRTRKRGRGPLSSPFLKRPRTHQMIPISSSPCDQLTSPHQGFFPGGFSQSAIASPSTLMTTLPLLSQSPTFGTNQPHERDIDLNTVVQVPQEKDLLRQLQEPHQSTATTTNVIAPQPVRPIGSSIRVGCINETLGVPPVDQYPKRPEQVEEEVESDILPAVISDSNNKVRLVNSAYKEMVGQPECSWLSSMVKANDDRLRLGCSSSCCQKISGVVALHLSDSKVPVSSKGFSCWVRIEWGSQGKKSYVNAFCDVSKLCCVSKDYLFTWRFHTPARLTSQT